MGPAHQARSRLVVESRFVTSVLRPISGICNAPETDARPVNGIVSDALICRSNTGVETFFSLTGKAPTSAGRLTRIAMTIAIVR